MASQEQLAGWASHILAPYLSGLVTEPAMKDDSSGTEIQPRIPDVAAKVWRALTASTAAMARDVDFNLIVLEASLPPMPDPAVMRSLSTEIELLLQASPYLRNNMETLWLSISKHGATTSES